MKKVVLSLMLLLMSVITSTAQTSLNQRILFKADSTNVMESQIAQLEMISKYINDHPSELIIIAGFTSKNTPADKVDALTTKRAEEVMKLLTTKYDVKPDHVMAIGVGVSTKYDDDIFNEYVAFMKTPSTSH